MRHWEKSPPGKNQKNSDCNLKLTGLRKTRSRKGIPSDQRKFRGSLQSISVKNRPGASRRITGRYRMRWKPFWSREDSGRELSREHEDSERNEYSFECWRKNKETELNFVDFSTKVPFVDVEVATIVCYRTQSAMMDERVRPNDR